MSTDHLPLHRAGAFVTLLIGCCGSEGSAAATSHFPSSAALFHRTLVPPILCSIVLRLDHSSLVAAPHAAVLQSMHPSLSSSGHNKPAMTLYYCHICEQNVTAIDAIKPPLAETQIEQKEASNPDSHAQHQLECEQCHQSYIEEVEPPHSAPTTDTAATHSTVPILPSTASLPQALVSQPAVQPQLPAQTVAAPSIFNLFSSPPFISPAQPPTAHFATQTAAAPFPFPYPFPGVQFNVTQPINASIPWAPTQPPAATAAGSVASPPLPFPFSALPFPFSAFAQASAGNLQPVASHPSNYAVNNTHFNQLLSSFLHPVQSQRRGLDPAVLARLQRRTVAAGEEGKEACVVCQCELACGEEVIALPGCGHCFHVGCIEPWLREHDLCPTCRRQVTATDVSSANQQASIGSNSTESGHDTSDVVTGASAGSAVSNADTDAADPPR